MVNLETGPLRVWDLKVVARFASLDWARANIKAVKKSTTIVKSYYPHVTLCFCI